MVTTKVTRTLALAGLVPAGKPSHACRGLLPVLALCVATAAWSQTPLSAKGPRRSFITQGMAPLPRPAVDTPASAQYKFITIAARPSDNTQAAGINNARLVTGFYEDASSNHHGFVWQAGTFQTVDYPGAVYTLLLAVNNRGVAISFYGDADNTEHAVMYSVPGGTWTALPDIPGYSENEGYGINDGGFAVGNAYEGDASVAWIWDPTTLSYSFFTEPGAAQYGTQPNGINDKGQIAGYFVDTSGVHHSFLKEGETYTTIDAPGASGTQAFGINNSGTIVGQWFDAAGASQGFVFTSSGLFTTVDYPGPELTGLDNINDRGDISGVLWQNPSGSEIAIIGLRP
jgi:uncharacterized membrane protein